MNASTCKNVPIDVLLYLCILFYLITLYLIWFLSMKTLKLLAFDTVRYPLVFGTKQRNNLKIH